MDNNAKTKIGALYGRISVMDEEYDNEFGSLQQQEIMGRDFAKQLSSKNKTRYEIKYHLIEEKGLSGGTTNRPKYQTLLNLIRSRKIDFVMAKEISRISRSTKDFCEFMELCTTNNVAVHIRGLDFDPTTPMGDMLFKFLANLAEMERKQICQRVKDGIVTNALEHGKINGGSVPLGFDRIPERAGFWKRNESELKSVEFIMNTFTETGSFKETLQKAHERGIKNKRGNQFTHSSLRHLLTNTKYVGRLKVKYGRNNSEEKWVSLPHGEAIANSLFQEAQGVIQRLDERRTTFDRLGTRVYLLTGLLYHSDGSSFRGLSGKSRLGSRRYYYYNETHKLSIAALEIEKAIFASLKAAYENDAELSDYMGQIERHRFSQLDCINQQIKSVKNELKKLTDQDQMLISNFASATTGGTTPKTLQLIEEQITKNEILRSEYEGRLAAMEKEKDNLGGSTVNAKKLRSRLENVFSQMLKDDPAKQRNFLRAIFKKIEISGDAQVKLTWAIPENFITGEEKEFLQKKWWAHQDSNLGPPRYEREALTN